MRLSDFASPLSGGRLNAVDTGDGFDRSSLLVVHHGGDVYDRSPPWWTTSPRKTTNSSSRSNAGSKHGPNRPPPEERPGGASVDTTEPGEPSGALKLAERDSIGDVVGAAVEVLRVGAVVGAVLLQAVVYEVQEVWTGGDCCTWEPSCAGAGRGKIPRSDCVRRGRDGSSAAEEEELRCCAK